MNVRNNDITPFQLDFLKLAFEVVGKADKSNLIDVIGGLAIDVAIKQGVHGDVFRSHLVKMPVDVLSMVAAMLALCSEDHRVRAIKAIVKTLTPNDLVAAEENMS